MFGPDSVALLLCGAAGGLTRGLVVLRSKLLGGPITWAGIIAAGIDVMTSIVVGAMFAVFVPGLGETILSPVLGAINPDATTRIGTEGFLSGLVGIAAVTLAMDFVDIRSKLKLQAQKEDNP